MTEAMARRKVEATKRFARVALIAAVVAPLAARAEDYPFDLRKANPRAFAAWARIVPSTYRREAWIAGLDGTSGPMEQVTMQGRVFYYGSVCKPHDCGGNNVAFLIAADGSSASGELDSETLGVNKRLFGAPDAEARQLLDAKASQ